MIVFHEVFEVEAQSSPLDIFKNFFFNYIGKNLLINWSSVWLIEVYAELSGSKNW